MILEKIKDNPQVLSWNEKGELKYQGETVPNTNQYYKLSWRFS
jgi:hypothetical protein